MPRWKKVTLITAGTILGLLLLSMLIVPWQIREQGSRWFAENTSRQLTIERAYFNPFTLTVEVSGVRLSEQNGIDNFVTLKRLTLSGSARSLLQLALILDRVELEEPFVNLALLGKQEFNFSDFTRLGEDQPPPTAIEPGDPLQFSFNNIVISGGAIDFTDQTLTPPAQHQVRELDLAVPFLGNIPYLTDEYVQPQLRLLLNDAEVRADGQLKPFHESLETRLTLLLDEVDLAYYAYHSPVPLPIEVKQGILDLHADLVYRISRDEQPKLLLGGELALSDIDLREPDGRELFRMPTLILELDWANLLPLDVNLLSLDIYRPELFVNRDSQGQWNFQRLLPRSAETNQSTDAAQPAADLPLFRAEQLALIDGRVHYQDALPVGGFSETFEKINLQLDNLSSHLDDPTALAFTLQTARGSSFEVDGQLSLQPLTADLELLLNGVPLEPHYPYLADVLTKPVAGTLNFASQVRYTADSNVTLQQLQLGLHELLVPFGGEDRFTLQDLNITGGSFDLQQLLLTLGSIKLAGGDLSATRTSDGALTPLQLLRQPAGKEEPTAAPESSGEPLKIAVTDFAIDQLNLKFTDASLPKQPQARIDQLSLSAQELSYPVSQQSPFALQGKIGQRGSFAFNGKLAHSPLRLQANTDVKAFPLADFNDFLPEEVKVSLKDGRFSSTLAVNLEEQPEGFGGSFSGKVSVSDFSLRDPLDQGELLAWENLNLDGIKGELAPFKLAISEVALSNYLAKIQIDQEGKVNLNSITAQQEAEQQAEATDTPPATAEGDAADAEDGGAPPDIRIEAVTLQGGTVSFTDRHLPSTFSTTMYQLGGRVTGLTADETMLADVDLRGQLENHSPLTITGKLNPLSKDLYADLTISFKDIDLAPMTPYSGTYLGYVIDKGKLYLDLSYKIEQQHISAKNKIMVDQFTFGDSVKSEQATSLPVALAVALLKDRDGEIHLDVPISGNLNDPDFSIAGAVFTILKNLLVKAATSPFSLLAALLPDGKDFSSLSFPPGIARLSEADSQKLSNLSGVLEKRPSLTLEVSSFVDPEQDPEGYRQDQLQQLLIDAKWQELQEDGRAPESRALVSINPEEYPQYLTRVYEEADFPRPRNFIGMLKKLPVAEMQKLLLSNIVVEAEQLQGLAQARALSVRDALLAANPELKPRIFLKTVDIYQPPKDGQASRVEFNISSK